MEYKKWDIASLNVPGPFALAYYQAEKERGCLFYTLFQKDGLLKYTTENSNDDQLYDDPITSLVIENDTLFLTTLNKVLCAALKDRVGRPDLKCIIPEGDLFHIPQPLHGLRLSYQSGVWVYAAIAGFSHTGETHCAIVLGAYRGNDEPCSPTTLYVDAPLLSLELSPMIRDSTLMFAYTCENQTITIGVLSLKKQEGEWQTQDESLYYRTRTFDVYDWLQPSQTTGRDIVVHTLAFAKSWLVLFPMDVCQGTSLSNCYTCHLDTSLDSVVRPLPLPGNRVYTRLYGTRSGKQATFIGERDGLFETISVEFSKSSDGTVQFTEVLSKSTAEKDTRPEPTIFYPCDEGLLIAAFPSRSGDKFLIRTYKRSSRGHNHYEGRNQTVRVDQRPRSNYIDSRPKHEYNDPKPRMGMDHDGFRGESQGHAPIMLNIPRPHTQQKPRYHEQ
ncbi:hypothetical protein GMRT_13542 [Giardia muris]|uniref:Uncharacterized protein n=1 Tax=Giardia muris TaxID=5742 RepID=A0A4Z1SVT1_GIAMU|nr:hypothetical protein GMRT_13542 [Giardia muris]|eukprot:TNJ29962.1 hypothetical protein GMRT_13542 [Giardia muris]